MITETKSHQYKGYTYKEEGSVFVLIRGFSRMPFDSEIEVLNHVEFLISNK